LQTKNKKPGTYRRKGKGFLADQDTKGKDTNAAPQSGKTTKTECHHANGKGVTKGDRGTYVPHRW